jgi:glycosyltransferase involved in cell wall biosynthesis
MKVLHVNNCAGVASNLVTGLRDLDIDAELFMPTIGTYRAPKIVKAFLPFIRTYESYKLGNYVRKRGFDIVHIHYARFAYMAFLAQISFVLHLHGGDLYVDLQRPGFRELTLHAIRRAKRVYCSTPDLYYMIKGFREDALFLPNPVDMREFMAKSKSFIAHPARILAISKLDNRKGIPIIIESLEKILQSAAEVEVCVFNFGKNRGQAKSFLERYQNNPRVVLLPMIQHSDMPGLIESSSIVLGQQSHDIGALGMSELEAMACSRPVICWFSYPDAYPSPPPVLISPDSDAAYSHMLSLLNDIDYCHSVGERSREWVYSNHDIHLVAQRLLESYLEI